MKITIERQPGCTGKDTWKSVLRIDGAGYQVEMLGGGETATEARMSLKYKAAEMQRAIAACLDDKS